MKWIVSSLLVASLVIHFVVYVLTNWIIKGSQVRHKTVPVISEIFLQYHVLFTLPVTLLFATGCFLVIRRLQSALHYHVYLAAWIAAEFLFVGYAVLALFAPFLDFIWVGMR